MGSYLNVDLGPYIIAKHINSTYTENKTVCVNTECNKFDKEVKSKFCPECGQQSESKKFERPTKLNAWSFLNNNDMEDRLIGAHAGGSEIYKDREILTPNQYMPAELKQIKVDSDFCGDVDLSDCAELCKSQTDWLLKEYEKEITALTEAGFEIEVKWGLIMSYS